MSRLATRTLGEVFAYAKAQFGDTSGVQITNEDITRAVNNACEEITSTHKVLRATATMSSIPGQDEYEKPAGCLQVTSLRYGQNVLRGVGFDVFQSIESFSEVQYWTQYGDTLIIGATPTSVEEMKIYYVPSPAKVTDASDLLPLPDRYFNRICEYVMGKMYELDEDWEAQQANMNSFKEGMLSNNYEEVNNSGAFTSVVPYDFD